MAIALEDSVTFETVRVPYHETAQVSLPALPQKPGKVVVLRFSAVAYCPRPGGCNYNATLDINGAAITRRTAADGERLIGREATFHLTSTTTDFQVFSGPRMMLMYAPDAEVGNAMTTDGLAATFVLDVTDLVSGVDGNTLSIVNTRPAMPEGYAPDLIIDSVEIGWLDRDMLPEPASRVPERGPIEQSIPGVDAPAEDLTLMPAASGGFALRTASGMELRIDTALGMGKDAPVQLAAADEYIAPTATTITSHPWGPSGFDMSALFDGLRLSRTVEIKAGVVCWKERWTNTSSDTRGVPFQHRFFLQGATADFIAGGDPDAPAMAASACNPTLFVKAAGGNGFGVTAESDWLRLLIGMRSGGGVADLYSETLALAPGASIDFEISITPVTDGGGYWTFINSLRERWGVNGITCERPMFWGYARSQDGDTDEKRLQNALGHLGPITLITGGWMRLTADCNALPGGRYVGEESSTAEQVEDFLTFAHRELWWEQKKTDAELIRRACPNANIMHMTHPAMEVVCEPFASRFPIASEAIITAEGKPFNVDHYNRAHLGAFVDRGWKVYYYTPRPGSPYLNALLHSLETSLDVCQSDGIYCDEFSWAGRTRGYSRYDYSRWDGYSADLNENGAVMRLKSDNAFTSESCQLRMVNEPLSRGKVFLGNGGNALRSVGSLPIHRFIEGGNGHGTMASGHLSAVPLVLGNMGDTTTRAGVFESVRQCLEIGCIYSPVAVNLLLEGSDNFVCKLYPITIRKIYAGTVIGRERLITSRSGTFNWPGQSAKIRLYTYNAGGDLTSAEVVDAPGPDFTIEVLDGGLVIAELQ